MDQSLRASNHTLRHGRCTEDSSCLFPLRPRPTKPPFTGGIDVTGQVVGDRGPLLGLTLSNFTLVEFSSRKVE